MKRLAAILMLLCARTVAAEPPLATSASEPSHDTSPALSHVWMALPNPGKPAARMTVPSAVHLLHVAPARDPRSGGLLQPLSVRWEAHAALPRMPEALAADSDRLWLAFAPDPQSRAVHRDVYALTVHHDPVFDLYTSTPHERLDLLPSLPGGGRLASFAGSPVGPLALLLPPPRGAAREAAIDPVPAAEPVIDQPRLMLLQHNEWIDLELPPTAARYRLAHLLIGGPDGQSIFMLGTDRQSGESAELSVAHLSSLIKKARSVGPPAPEAASSWSTTPVALDMRRLRGSAQFDGRSVVVIDTGVDRELSVIEVRGTGLAELTRVERPATDWAFVAMLDRPALLTVTRGQDLALQMIDIQAGRPLDPLPIVERSLLSSQAMITTVALVGLFVVLLGLTLIRPIAGGPIAMPPTMTLLPLPLRAAALAIDLLPGALVAVVFERDAPWEVLHPPILTFDPNRLVGWFIMVGVTCVHTLAGEALLGQSLGKAVVGARIVTLDLATPSRGLRIIRVLVRSLTLLIPPFVVVPLINPNMLAVHDAIARTVVVKPTSHPASDDDQQAD